LGIEPYSKNPGGGTGGYREKGQKKKWKKAGVCGRAQGGPSPSEEFIEELAVVGIERKNHREGVCRLGDSTDRPAEREEA